jgi:hypothetical protein
VQQHPAQLRPMGRFWPQHSKERPEIERTASAVEKPKARRPPPRQNRISKEVYDLEHSVHRQGQKQEVPGASQPKQERSAAATKVPALRHSRERSKIEPVASTTKSRQAPVLQHSRERQEIERAASAVEKPDARRPHPRQHRISMEVYALMHSVHRQGQKQKAPGASQMKQEHSAELKEQRE